MMFIPLQALALAFTFFAAHGSVQAQNLRSACPSLTPVFRNITPAPVYERRLGLLDIEALAQTKNQHSSAGGRITGLYVAELDARNETQVQTYRDGPHVLACFSTFNASLTLVSTVYVPSEFAAGSCAERAVAEHEFAHHKIQVSTQEKAVASFLAKNPLPTIPFRGVNQNAAHELAKQWSGAYLRALTQSAGQFAQPLQEQLDSPEEYFRVSALCSADFKRVFAARPKR